MNAHPPPPPSAGTAAKSSGRGFTLIELMLVLLVIGVLVAIAYPSFVDQVRKSRRADAIAALTSVQQAQERWRANNPAYAPFNSAAAESAANGLAAVPTKYYSLSIQGLSPTTYTLVASALDTSSQVHDENCQQIGVRASGGVLRYGSGSSSINWSSANPDTGNCWAR